MKLWLTTVINEWGFNGQETLVVLGMSATNHEFKLWRGYEPQER